MGIRDQFDRLSSVRAIDKIDANKRHSARSKEQLIEIIEKKFKTTFIGALSCFETEVGFLWGHGKEYKDLTENERKWLEVWNRIRTTILNNGNNQARAVINELQQYCVNLERYNMELPVVNKSSMRRINP